jgi:hypothetical protein
LGTEDADDDEGSESTERTARERGSRGCRRIRWRGRIGRGEWQRFVQQSASEIEFLSTRRTPEAVVTHLGKAAGEHMLEETAEKLDTGEGDAAQLLSAVVAIAEGHVAVVEGLETTIADGDAEQIAAQVVEHLLAAARRLSVHHPGYLPDAGRRMLE